MFRPIIKFFDFLFSFVLITVFLFVIGTAIILSVFRRPKKGHIRDIVQLYISIIDFRESVLSTYKEDILLDGFIRRAFSYHFDFDRKKSDEANITNDIYMCNFSVHPDNIFTRLGLTRTIACLVEIKAFFMMLKTILKENVNIIRAHDPHLLGFNAFALSRLTNRPFIVQVCSNYELKDRRAKGLTFKPFMFQVLERWFERTIMRAADTVMTDREHYRSFGLIPKDIPDEKYANIGFFVDKIHYTANEPKNNLRSELGIAATQEVLLYVGRLVEVKYPFDLLRMFKVVLESKKDTLLLIAGDGTLRENMEKMADENGIRKNISFLKQLPQDKIRDLYYISDVVCFTSAGFTMIEAALAKRCIIAYDFEWHSEFIGKNERGILIPFGDYNKFAEEVLDVLANPGLRNKLGENAKSYALKNYSRERSVDEEIGFYRNIFKRRGYEL